MLSAWEVVEGEVVRASISSVRTLEHFISFRNLHLKAKMQLVGISQTLRLEKLWQKEKDQQSWPRVIDKISIYRSIFLYLAVVYPVILISGMFHSPGVLTVHSIISPSSFFAENAYLPISSFPVILSILGK